jgi:hypothetical protein
MEVTIVDDAMILRELPVMLRDDLHPDPGGKGLAGRRFHLRVCRG